MSKPENRKPVERRPDGTVAGGGSLNPGGRPKGYADFRAACREHTAAAIGRLVEALADDKLCVQAAQTILAYGWGKPASAPEDLDAVKDAGPKASREAVMAALAGLAKEGA